MRKRENKILIYNLQNEGILYENPLIGHVSICSEQMKLYVKICS